MNKFAFFAVFLAVLPAFATIAQQRNTFNWTCSGATNTTTGKLTCPLPAFSTTGATDLIVVWITWQSATTLTASVSDNFAPPSQYTSAVGPTIQSASSMPMSAQMFYAKNILGGAVTITVTLQGPIPGGTSVPSFGVVAVEYSGLDTQYPLDSVSAGYSTSGNPTSLMDSGTVAPANSNLLVFSGGTSDNTTGLAAGSGFSSIQSHNGTSGSSLVEANTTAISGNNVLQRSTATLTPALTTGNWLMQMAIFRDASWTVTGGWSPARQGNLLYANPFPNVQSALSSLPPNGGGVATPHNYRETLLSNLSIGTGTTQPARLKLNSDSILTANGAYGTGNYAVTVFDASSLSCDPSGAGSGSGEVGGCTLATGSGFTGDGLIQTGSVLLPSPYKQEYFALDKMFIDCTKGTQNKDCVNLTNIYANSFLRDTVMLGSTNTPIILHFTGYNSQENSNDVMIDNVWSNCEGMGSCKPLVMEKGAGGGGPFANNFVGGTFNNPGATVPVALLTDNTENTNFFGTNFSQNGTTSPTKEVVDLQGAEDTTFIGASFGLCTSCTPNNYGIINENIHTPDALNVVGGWFSNGHAINNAVSGTMVNQTYVPFYFWGTSSSPGWFDLPVMDTQPFTSTVPTGTAPFVVASTTPVANLTTAPAVYNAAGTQTVNAHIVSDTATLTSGTPANKSVTLAGAAAFASSTSYSCVANNLSAAANTLQITNNSGSQFTVTSVSAAPDTFSFICTGN